MAGKTSLSRTNLAINEMRHVVWRGNQMASYQTPTLSSGFPHLDAQLPDAGWPQSVLIELLIQQPGMGEIQLLKPALIKLAQERRIAFIQPPHSPYIAAFQSWGISSQQLVWVNSKRATDALWATGQILRNGSCGAVLLWQTQTHATALRRLHLAAQETNTSLWMIRPQNSAVEASPSPLRLVLRPALAGLEINLIKRRGAPCAAPFYVKTILGEVTN